MQRNAITNTMQRYKDIKLEGQNDDLVGVEEE